MNFRMATNQADIPVIKSSQSELSRYLVAYKLAVEYVQGYSALLERQCIIYLVVANLCRFFSVCFMCMIVYYLFSGREAVQVLQCLFTSSCIVVGDSNIKRGRVGKPLTGLIPPHVCVSIPTHDMNFKFHISWSTI